MADNCNAAPATSPNRWQDAAPLERDVAGTAYNRSGLTFQDSRVRKLRREGGIEALGNSMEFGLPRRR